MTPRSRFVTRAASRTLAACPSPAQTQQGAIASVGVTVADFDHDGVADAAAFTHPDLKCDHVKRRLVAEKRFAVTSDRHITWT